MGAKTARVDVLTNGHAKWVAGGHDHHWISIMGIVIHTASSAKSSGNHKLKRLGLHHGWRNYGHGYGPASSILNGAICTVSGLIRKHGGMARHLTTLPHGCRPNKRIIFNLNNHQNTLRVDVLSNGQVHYVAGRWQHGWINLDGIQFAVSHRHSVRLASNWRAYGHSYGHPTYTKTGHICEVEGLIRSGHWGHAMAVLPGNCRPRKRLIFNLNNHGKPARVDVQTNGHVTWHAGGRDHHWISLGGIMFATDNGKGLAVHSRWRNYGHSYGSATVSKQGNLCLVSGLVRSGHWRHTMVTLPSECRPRHRMIFNMNNHAKTARVDVLTNGHVKWVAGGHDHHWISITGIVIHTSSSAKSSGNHKPKRLGLHHGWRNYGHGYGPASSILNGAICTVSGL